MCKPSMQIIIKTYYDNILYLIKECNNILYLILKEKKYFKFCAHNKTYLMHKKIIFVPALVHVPREPACNK